MKKTLIFALLQVCMVQLFCSNVVLTPAKGYRGQKMQIKFSSSSIDLNQVSSTNFALRSASATTLIPGSTLFFPNSIQRIDGKNVIGDFDFTLNAACGNYYPLFISASSTQINNTFNIDCSPTAVISGSAYIDANNNNVFDPGEMPIKNHLINIPSMSLYTYTNEMGYYQFSVPNGSYTISALSNKKYSLTSNGSISTSTTVSIPSQHNDFRFKLNTFHDVSISMYGSCFRADRTRQVYLQIQNKGTTAQTPGFKINLNDSLVLQSITEYRNGKYNNISFVNNGSNAYTVNAINGNLLLEESRFYILNIYSKLTTLGISSIQMSCNITAANVPDDNPLDNSSTVNVLYCNSFDPNDKTVVPAGLGSNKEVLKADWLEYTIRFQNTGTDTAYLIYIDDTLDQFVDISTFTVMNSSHQMTYSLDDNNKVRFIFADINLVDSGKNQLLSNGFVRYKVKVLNTIPEGYVLKNKAYIYFDYNSAIITNTTASKMVTKYSSVLNYAISNLHIYPVPVQKGQWIVMKNEINKIEEIHVFDINGKQVLSELLSTPLKEYQLKVELSNGLYITRVKLADGTIVNNKIVVE